MINESQMVQREQRGGITGNPPTTTNSGLCRERRLQQGVITSTTQPLHPLYISLIVIGSTDFSTSIQGLKKGIFATREQHAMMLSYKLISCENLPILFGGKRSLLKMFGVVMKRELPWAEMVQELWLLYMLEVAVLQA